MRASRILIPLIVSLALFGVYWFLRETPLWVRGYGDVREAVFGKDLKLLRFAMIAAFIFLAVRSLDAFLFDLVLSRRRRTGVPILLRELVSLVLFLVLFGLAITAVFGAKWTTVLTTTTIVAAVIGLALQDTLGNLFAGIALHMEDTFKVGDVLRCGDHIGMVEGVTWRATRIRTVNNNLVVLPNSVISRERIEVYPAENLNARLISVSLSYDAPPAKVIAVLEQAARNVEGVAHEIPAFARIGAFGESGITYDIKYWTRTYQNRDNIEAALRRAIWYAIKRNRLEIPFPVRVLYRHPTPHREVNIENEEISKRLHEVDVLAPLSSDEHEEMGMRTRVRRYSEGETILRFGQPGDSMFVLHEGRVSIRVPVDGEPSREIAQVDAGTVFGEMALLTGEARSADVVAITDVTALEIDKNCLQPLLHDNPGLAAAITNKVLERRAQLSDSRVRVTPEERKTLLGRIRSYFGLR